MKKEINFGIGFISGRPNVCHVINNYYKFILEQLDEADVKVNLTIFILFDLKYQHTTRIDFYCILPEVYKNINIKYITPEDIVETKKKIISQHNMSAEDVDLLIGEGYAKARNTILFYALKRKMDYLMFWDDDEYPCADIRKNNEIIWIKQETLKKHLESIVNTDITVGDRCGVMSPVPYIEYNNVLKEEDYKNFIDGISNEVILWENIKKTRVKDGFLKYAEEDIALAKVKPRVISKIGETPIIYGSNLCLNLDHLDKIPAFYNPPGARGEDSFFACATVAKKTEVVSIPAYHFHDGFLKFTGIMKGKYPKGPLKINLEDGGIEQRFYKATLGWIKYKPLYFYINDREHYREIIDTSIENLEKSVDKVSKQFETCDFRNLISDLKAYDKDVKKHYNEYVKVTEIWDKLKYDI